MKPICHHILPELYNGLQFTEIRWKKSVVFAFIVKLVHAYKTMHVACT